MCNKYIVIWSGLESSSHVNPYLCALFYWVIIMNKEYFNVLKKLLKKAVAIDEVPVSALIVKNGKIIAKAFNKRNKNHDILGHAEIIAIKKASQKLKDWRLFECDLYVTLKPCSICENIIKQSRIQNVYYLIDKPDNKREFNKTKFTETNISMQKEQYKNILNQFFQKKRYKR